jgi:hypothetical protein
MTKCYEWIDPEKIEEEARREYAQENFRFLVEERKAQLRYRKPETPWWHWLLPFTITITWR